MTRQPDSDEPVDQWTLLPDELRLVAGKPTTNRLGFALMLKFFARRGRFPRGRWRAEPLTIAQRREVDRLGRQVARNRDVAAAILALAEELKATTIDAILAKSDLELGLELLTGRSN